MSDTSWYYLSFAGDEGWRGAAYVRATNDVDAIKRAWRLGINPGGEVMLVGPLTETDLAKHVAPEDRERLLTREEIGPYVRRVP